MASRLVGLLLALTLPHLSGAFAPGAYLAPRLSPRAAVSPLHALRCSELSGSTPSSARRAILQGLAVLPLAALGTLPATAAPAGAGETVLVVGARGYIGEYVVAELQRQGARVRALTRDANPPKEGVFGDVDWMIGDLNKPATITADVVKGASRIIFCPGAHGWEDAGNNKRIYDEAVS
ncbi:hypothetical protein T484DRAFT_1795400, partial [Baffinella frigidus]